MIFGAINKGERPVFIMNKSVLKAHMQT